MTTAPRPAPAATDPTDPTEPSDPSDPSAPSDPAGPRLLRVGEPSELLAESRLAMHADLRDSLVMIGHGGEGRPLFSRTDLRHVAGPSAPEHVEHHLTAVREHGHPRAVALFVLGDGHDDLPPGLPGEAAAVLGALLLRSARELLPEPVAIDACWVLGAGVGHRVLPGAFARDGEEVAVSPLCPLVPCAETAAAAHAVLEGQPVAQVLAGDPGPAEQRLLCALGASLSGHGTLSSLPAAARAIGRGAADEEQRARDLPRVLAAAREVLHRVVDLGGGGTADPSPLAGAGPAAAPGGPVADDKGSTAVSVTDCEPLAELILLLGIGTLDWRLFALCVDHGRAEETPVEELLDRLVDDPDMVPHPDVRAGGVWFRDLERLRLVCEELALAPAGPASGAGDSAWRGLTAVLVLLQWWNHRFASAGDLVDELLEAQPGCPLAPLLTRLIDAPISPAWRPGR